MHQISNASIYLSVRCVAGPMDAEGSDGGRAKSIEIEKKQHVLCWARETQKIRHNPSTREGEKEGARILVRDADTDISISAQ